MLLENGSVNIIAELQKKPKNTDTFLYQHFKRTDHSPLNVSVQPVEKINYDETSSSRLKISKDIILN